MKGVEAFLGGRLEIAVDIALGENHACALRSTGVLSCWGDDGAQQLGDNDGNTADTGVPVDVTGLPGIVDAFDVGLDHACAVSQGEVYCWGSNYNGVLGAGTMGVVSQGPSGIPSAYRAARLGSSSTPRPSAIRLTKLK